MIFDSQYSVCKVDQSIIVSKENGNEHILYNQSKVPVYQFHIDGGIVKNSIGEKCDFVVETQGFPKSSAYIIELKGSDLNKAISQIVSTIEEHRDRMIQYKLLPRIIIHKANTHDIRGKKYRDFQKKYPDTVVKVKKYEESV